MKNIDNNIALIEKFPDTKEIYFFKKEEWNSQFQQSNVIVHCKGNDVFYTNHWGSLSVKCAFGGNEYYLKNRCKYAVSAEKFLVLNEGTQYASYIQSDTEVESLTIHFNARYESEVAKVVLLEMEKLIDDPLYINKERVFFEEKLYAHNSTVSSLIYTVRELSKNFLENKSSLNEVLYFLLEAMLLNNTEIIKEINKIDAAKPSTRIEIYRRLNEAKDYIDSCYNEDITLDDLSNISLMSPFHLLRQFKKNYGITPHQYLMNRRLEQAKMSILTTDKPLTDICFIIGFKDMSSYSKLFKRKYGLSPLQYRHKFKD
jgi:AraC-like DNA-binding protein